MEQSPILLACAADQNFAQPLGVMLASVGANLGPNAQVLAYVVDLGISCDERTMIEQTVSRWSMRVVWVRESLGKYAGLPLWGRMTAATYAKLDLPDLLPDGATKAIWLDADLVVTTDISRLWNEELDNALLRAVPDELVTSVASTGGVTSYKQLGLSADATYFNAGVMLFDPTAWKRDSVRERSLEYLFKHSDEIYFWDQEALNVVAVGRWKPLDARWNLNASVPMSGRDTSLMGGESEPWVVHYTGQLKPWTHGSSTDSLRQLYFHYLDLTPWAGWRPSVSAATNAVTWYERSGLRSIMYPFEKLAMRISRRLSRRLAQSGAVE